MTRKKQEVQEAQASTVVIDDRIDPEGASTEEQVESFVKAAEEGKSKLAQAYIQAMKVNIPGFEEAVKRAISPLAEFGKSTLESISDDIRPALSSAELFDRLIPEGTRKAIENALNMIREYQATTLISENTKDALRIMGQLAPYINAEADEHPELYKGEDKKTGSAFELIAAAARRARADGIDIPPLKAEQPEPMELQLDFPTKNDSEGNRRKHIAEAHKRRDLARQQGALASTETRLATIGMKSLGFDYFTSVVCKMLPAGIETFILDEQGRINVYDLTGGDKPIEEVLKEVDSLHTAFLMWLLGLAWNNSDIRETNSGNAIMPVYLPTVLEAMGIDPRPIEWDKHEKKVKRVETSTPLADLRLNKFMSFLSPLNYVAAWFGGDLYAIAGFDHYNRESETVYIRAPYMFRLVEYAKLHATKHGAISNIFHADIMTENQTAVEIANRIAMALIERGVTTPDYKTYKSQRKPIKKKTTKTAPDGTRTVEELTYSPEPETIITKTSTDEDGTTTTITEAQKKEKIFTINPRFSTLIADCPQLQREIDSIRHSSDKDKSQRINKKLKDTFTAAIKIIMEKSEIPQYYKDLTIKTGRFDTFKAPTNSTLGDELIIKHYGKNPNFSD